jgi:hypothetical protein
MGRSITTWDWKDHLFGYFEKNGTKAQVNALNDVDWNVGNDMLAIMRGFNGKCRRRGSTARAESFL